MRNSNYKSFNTAIGIISILSICISCGKDKTVPSAKNPDAPVARVLDEYLYVKDLEGLAPKNTSSTDSAKFIRRYIDSWVKKQLLIAEAAENIEFDKNELQRKLLDYKYALLVYEYQKLYISSKLNNDISEKEIKEYYQNNLDNFQLKQNIIQCRFIKIPKETPRVNRLRNLIQADSKKEINELKSYCFRFATSFYLEDSVWVNFDDVVKNTPLVNIPDKIQVLKRNKYMESSDEDFLYLLYVKNYVISDQISPLDFVKDQIKSIIINKRKLALTKKLEEEIYKTAQKDNDFEIFVK